MNPIRSRPTTKSRLVPTWYENCPTGLEKPHCNTVVKMVKPNLLVGILGVMVNESENYKLFLCYKLISKTKYVRKKKICVLNLFCLSIQTSIIARRFKNLIFFIWNWTMYKSWIRPCFQVSKGKGIGQYVFWKLKLTCFQMGL